MLSLFDIQVNGYAGVDFQRRDLRLDEASRAVMALRATGTHRFLVTLITDDTDAIAAKLALWEQFRFADKIVGETVAGYHLEGPYLNAEPGYSGAHPPECMKDPNIGEFERLQKAAGGQVRMVTLAPERKGSIHFIQHLSAENIVVALGHTAASDDDIDAAIDAGARLVTHLGNGIPAHLHRHDNVMMRLLARDELLASFIPDGIHLPPQVFKNLVRAKGAERVILTTDCMAAAGAPPGHYTLGRNHLEVGQDRVVRSPGSNLFAGSSLTPPEGVVNAAAWTDLNATEARAAFSSVPAALCGIELPNIELSGETP